MVLMGLPEMMRQFRAGLPGVPDEIVAGICALLMVFDDARLGMTVRELEDEVDLILVQYGFEPLAPL